MEDTCKVKEQEDPQTHKCQTCQKTYPRQSELETHKKTKHRQQQPKQPPKKYRSQPRNRVLEVQQNEHQDTIYAYMGELGEKNQQNSSRQELIMSEQLQRESIQTNYSFNKVIRTPYQKQINPIKFIPHDWIKEHPHKQLLDIMVKQISQLYDKLSAQKQRWQFRDPMGPEEQADDQFSLMEIRKLTYNYPKRGIKMRYPHFSIFLLWVGRICKPPAWIEFFMIISQFLIDYYNSDLTGKKSENWEKFSKAYEIKPVKPELIEKLSICDDKTVKKMIEYFSKWAQLFQLVEY